MFSGFLTLGLTQVFFPKPLLTFLTCIGGEMRKESLRQPGDESATFRSQFRYSASPAYPTIKHKHARSEGYNCCQGMYKLSINLSIKSLKSAIIEDLYFLTLSQISPGFTCPQNKSFKDTVGKGEIDRDEQFLLFSVFSTSLKNCLHFHQI